MPNSIWFDYEKYSKIRKDYQKVKEVYSELIIKENSTSSFSKMRQAHSVFDKKELLSSKRIKRSAISQKVLLKTEIRENTSISSKNIHFVNSHFYEENEDKFNKLSLTPVARSDKEISEDSKQSVNKLKLDYSPIGSMDSEFFGSENSTFISSKDPQTTKASSKPIDSLEFIPIQDWFLTNIFTKQSQFWDIFGKKILLEVDWDYLDSRYWDITHAYLKDKFYEYLLSYSLSSKVINPHELSHFSETASISSAGPDLIDHLTEIATESDVIMNMLIKNYVSLDDSNQGKFI